MAITIGKSSDNDYVVNDLSVSRHHARLVREEGIWYLEDLNSSNGTYINDVQILKKKVAPTDKIRLGATYETDLDSLLKSQQKMRPVDSFHRAHGYMDLFAVFSFAAVNGCAGQGSARRQHQRNPEDDIAVVAGFRGSGFAGCRGVRISVV